MKYRKQLMILWMFLGGLHYQILATPSINNLFGKWEIDGFITPTRGIYCFNKETYQSFVGKQVEFRAKYLVIDGKQHHHPRYLIKIRPFEEFMENFPYEIKSKQGPMLVVKFEAYAGYELLGRRLYNIIIDQNRLIMHVSDYMLTLKRCPDPPFFRRVNNSIKMLCSRNSYDPHKEVPAAMFGKWEIYRKAKGAWAGLSEEATAQCIGKQIELRPRYLIIDGRQYNNPRYWCENKKSSYPKRIILDRYSGYQLLGQTFTEYDYFSCQSNDELKMRLGTVDFWLRRCS